ncbi:MAG: hypothetical protein A2Y59_04725 [Chloroflexi bacterium RBG_13_52_14]|nr:MAG: hypothetical protein A2Y59_04725 [Chloroflexi bacterium RBG_13_52_14]
MKDGIFGKMNHKISERDVATGLPVHRQWIDPVSSLVPVKSGIGNEASSEGLFHQVQGDGEKLHIRINL